MVMGGPVLVWFRRWFCCALFLVFLSASGGFVCVGVGWSRLCGSVRVGGLWPRPFFFWANLSLWGNFGAQHQAPQKRRSSAKPPKPQTWTAKLARSTQNQSTDANTKPTQQTKNAQSAIYIATSTQARSERRELFQCSELQGSS